MPVSAYIHPIDIIVRRYIPMAAGTRRNVNVSFFSGQLPPKNVKHECNELNRNRRGPSLSAHAIGAHQKTNTPTRPCLHCRRDDIPAEPVSQSQYEVEVDGREEIEKTTARSNAAPFKSDLANQVTRNSIMIQMSRARGRRNNRASSKIITGEPTASPAGMLC